MKFKYNKKDYKYRHQLKKKEKDRLVLKYLITNLNLPKITREKSFYILKNKNIKLTRIQNRCIITGRSRSVLSKYGLSRLMFRNFFSEGLLKGFKKSSW